MAVEGSMDFETELEEEIDGRPAHDGPSKRRCLCCGELFSSTGWNNRLCGACKRRDGPPSF